MNSDKEYFIRELTRKLNEQINSVRRELDNLKKLGFLKSKTKLGKKYYFVNKNFILIEELKSIIVKALSSNEIMVKDIEKMGDIKVLALSGIFVDKETSGVDMLIVGEVNRERLSQYINNELRTKRPVKFTVLSENDYKYRIQCNDRFVKDIISDTDNMMPINKLRNKLEKTS